MQLAQDIKSMYNLNHTDVRKIFAHEWAKACRRHGFRKHVEQDDLVQGFYMQLMHRRTLESGFDYTVDNPTAQFATYMYTCICTYIKDYIQRDRRHSLGVKADTFKNSDGALVLVSESLLGVYHSGTGAQTNMNATPAYGQDFVWSGNAAGDGFDLKDFCCEVEKDRSLDSEDRKLAARLAQGLGDGLGTKEMSLALRVNKQTVSTWRKHIKEVYHKYSGLRGK